MKILNFGRKMDKMEAFEKWVEELEMRIKYLPGDQEKLKANLNLYLDNIMHAHTEFVLHYGGGGNRPFAENCYFLLENMFLLMYARGEIG